jgi:hypothetical protein
MTMADYYTRSRRAAQLAGMGENTQKAYTRAVSQLVRFFDKPPEELSESDLEDDLLPPPHPVTGWSAATLRIAHAGIKFFFRNVLQRDWHLFVYLDAKRERRLPCILSRKGVFRVLAHGTTFHNYVFLATVYACGLRLSEALSLHRSPISTCRAPWSTSIAARAPRTATWRCPPTPSRCCVATGACTRTRSLCSPLSDAPATGVPPPPIPGEGRLLVDDTLNAATPAPVQAHAAVVDGLDGSTWTG